MTGANAGHWPINKVAPSKSSKNTIGMSQNFFRARRKLQDMTADMKPKDKDLFPCVQ